MNEITFDKISYSNVSLADVIPDLKARTKERDPDGKGMRFFLPLGLVRGWTNFTTTRLPAGYPPGLDSTSIKINVAEMKNASLLDVLEAMVKSANYPLIYSIDPDGVAFSLITPQVADGNVHTNTARQKISQKVNEITFDKVSYANLPLVEVIRNLTEETKRRDPDEEGLNFLLNRTQPTINQYQSWTNFDPTTGEPISQAPSDFDIASVKITAELKNVRLADALLEIVKGADHPIRCSFLDYGVEFSPKPTGPELHTRTFRVDMKKFFEKYPVVATPYGTNADDPTAIQITVIQFFNEVGVNLAPPKSVFFNDRQGTFTVRATDSDLEHIIDRRMMLANSTLRRWISREPTRSRLHAFTRTFKLDVNTFFLALQKIGVLPVATNGIVSTATTPSGQRTLQRVMSDSDASTFRSEFQNALLTYFKGRGVDLQAPKSIFYNDRQSTLTVRATEEDLGKLEQWIAELNTPEDSESAKADAPVLNTRTF